MKLPTDPESALFPLVAEELLMSLDSLSSLDFEACVTPATMASAIVDMSSLDMVADEIAFVSLSRGVFTYLRFFSRLSCTTASR